MPREVRAELRGLPKDLAAIVAAHLVAAAELLDIEPQLAHEHAQAARRRAARLPVVREAAAEAAYAIEDWHTALSEYRAITRMTGNQNYAPVIANCERALGRPQEALRVLRQTDPQHLEPGMRGEWVLEEAGARADLGQQDEAMRVLRDGARQNLPQPELARIHYALAELLLPGDERSAIAEFQRADGFDADHLLDVDDRLAALGVQVDGADIDILALYEDDDDDEDDDLPQDDDSQDESGDQDSQDEPGDQDDADTTGPDVDRDAQERDAQERDAQERDAQNDANDPDDANDQDAGAQDFLVIGGGVPVTEAILNDGLETGASDEASEDAPSGTAAPGETVEPDSASNDALADPSDSQPTGAEALGHADLDGTGGEPTEPTKAEASSTDSEQPDTAAMDPDAAPAEPGDSTAGGTATVQQPDTPDNDPTTEPNQ